VSREEPCKEKTRRPERRGITGAVSPKKIGRERKECPTSGTSDKRFGKRKVRFKPCDRSSRWESPMIER
jgi:hypothetical protein